MIKKKVMVAEDDTGILEAMQFMLEDAGYEVVAIEDGRSSRICRTISQISSCSISGCQV
jgi:CheY-like chemotaxis protein